MEATKVNINDLRIGKVIAEDIYANTQYPIVLKNTKINQEHLYILKAFNILQIPILLDEKDQVIKGKQGIEENSEIINIAATQVVDRFGKKYTDTVEEFKKMFNGWGAGAKIDITKVRGLILPLVEKILEDRTIIFDLNSLSNVKDYLYHHCIATGLICAAITQRLGYERGYVLQMAIAGTLADCGMARIPLRIREKKEPLNQIEYDEIRKHPLYSLQMVKALPAIKEEMKEAIYQHHERLDGSGYPEKVRVGSVSNFGQIIAVADTFHAMTSERLYRSKESPFKVIEMIKESEFGKFDIQVVQALVDLVAALPIGTKIELSNLERGEIMFINKFAPTRPLIKLTNTGEIIDLSRNRSFYISRVITNE
ncbi:HD-GYP domain-containing protein (c-di-GMP phosphodiesterase class II) [Ureibacillus xyleni]|uniref:HD-GYP domain-containing protein (C-di-GMP phosphodiesterase class II) n=1 Tax=Ureibacillus xyleni TaxID=614648 RepID=A0A285SKD9_9BACL|nr:HD-GYP domain-containing protein [Ureibacillus xyleni]SOC08049.1 HD-GYP domain-containing protein (c-di-GMP phosphodiesterase class II) [Ureibacillus xyleni]